MRLTPCIVISLLIFDYIRADTGVWETVQFNYGGFPNTIPMECRINTTMTEGETLPIIITAKAKINDQVVIHLLTNDVFMTTIKLNKGESTKSAELHVPITEQFDDGRIVKLSVVSLGGAVDIGSVPGNTTTQAMYSVNQSKMSIVASPAQPMR